MNEVEQSGPVFYTRSQLFKKKGEMTEKNYTLAPTHNFAHKFLYRQAWPVSGVSFGARENFAKRLTSPSGTLNLDKVQD